MGGIIKLLPDHIANQIAAGEVIQRPSSVVKELVENSIDAGATKIDIIIKDAGRTLIQIIDNGNGMSMFDAEMCFERHATSKLKDAQDLFKLTTKGFRGEALASIAAISQVTLRTCQKDDKLGTRIEIEGSDIRKNEPEVCPVGTSLEIKNLFFNVPARRNFLKSDSVEFKHILHEFERIALPHHEVQLSLHHNGESIYQLNPSNLRKRIVDLNNRNYNDKLVPVDETTEIVGIQGFVVKPEAARKSRGEQFLFVNNRYFRDNYLNNAVQKAFDQLLQPGTFPSYYLFLTVDPGRIDVNVHPTKTEIKFEEERLIYSIIRTAVKQALGKFNIMPTIDFEQEHSFDLPYSHKKAEIRQPEIQINKNYNPFDTNIPKPSSGVKFEKSNAISNAGFNQEKAASWENFYSIEDETEVDTETINLEFESVEHKNFLVAGNFLLTNAKSGLMSIQYRRAYERIVYDELMGQFITSPIASQGMLFPYEWEMKKDEKTIWESNALLLKQLGLVWEFEKENMTLSSIPSILPEDGIPAFIQMLLEQMMMEQIDKGEIAHHFVLSLSKAASMKKKLILSNENASDLVQSLFGCKEHVYSPSGKLILKTITFEQLEN
jgi:DNA mismatch repair protein MutL|tara:strand:+ start:19136 stop:20953 length:1818 start_codon:yes stop_codon:yes gene_type:complete